ncbi:MAG: flagellin FliC [Oligoflexia bacterium]|nr:flagellin FliC [Oligoflexia bacterium]
MGLRINTNIQALAAQRNLRANREEEGSVLEKLASGSRINRAGDDAAGLAISEKLRANIRSFRQAGRNANDGISLLQTAEGALNETGNILVRFRELAIQAASDTIGEAERGYLDIEVQQLKTELQRIARTTEFNGTKLLDAVANIREIQIGKDNDADNDRFYYDVLKTAANPERLGVQALSVATKFAAQSSLAQIDRAINKVSGTRAEIGALQNRLESTIRNLGITDENLSASRSRISDADMASLTADLTRSQILTNSNIAILSQANQGGKIALKLLGG